MAVELAFGMILGVVFGAFIGGVLFLLFMFMNAPFKYIISIRNYSAGKPYIEQFPARIIAHKKLGQVYFVPKLKAQFRQYVPTFGSTYEYPIMRGGAKKYFVPVSFRDGTYAPEKSDDMVKEHMKTIVWSKNAEGKMIPSFEEKELTISVSRPTKSSMRQFNLTMDTQIKDEFKDDQDWWVKNGPIVLSVGIVMIAAIFAIFMIIGAQDAVKNITSAGAGQMSENIAQNVAGLLNKTSTATANGNIQLPPIIGK